MSAWELDSPVNASRWQQGCVAFFYLLALAAIWVAYILVWLKVGLSVLLLILFLFEYRRQKILTVTRLSTHQNEWFFLLLKWHRCRIHQFS